MENINKFILHSDDLKEYIEQLVDYLNYHTALYDAGKPEVSDYDWDRNYFELVRLEAETGIYLPNSPTQNIHYEIMNKLKKVEHNHPMLSLAKTKDWNEFLQYFDNINSGKSVTGMIKLDGLTCSLRYINGQLISAETRGNGVIGEDILHNAMVIKSIPKKISYQEELIIDGEIICTEKDFKEFENEYANPRNFASGSIRLLDSKECEKRNLTFICWNVVKGFYHTNSFYKKLDKLDLLGFKTTPRTSSFDWDAKEFLIDRAKKFGYPIDGLVGRFDDIEFGNSLGNTDHHIKSAYAFKFYDEEVETTMIDIEWGLGKTGVLTPVAVFKPIELKGSIVERASLHNISVMTEIIGSSWVGQPIKVFKANEIIPQISWAELEKPDLATPINIPDVCPVCGGKTKIIINNGVKTLICSDNNCQGKLINKLDAFCGKNGLDIKGLSKATLEKLIDWQWINSYQDIFELNTHRDEWIQKEGFGIKSVDNILLAIQNSCSCNLPNFLSALNIPLISLANAKEICKYINSYEELRMLIDDRFDFTEWNGFGEEKKNAILNYDYTEIDIIVNKYVTIKEIKNKKQDKPLEGINFVVTGTLEYYKNRNELKSVIENYGGKVISSVSRNTNYLINNNIESTSSKNLTAKKLNIPIITENDFLEIIKNF